MSASFPVLTFHAIDDRRSVISFPPRVFEHGLALLQDRGYRTLSLVELADCIRRGASLPKRSFVITFDDGYRSVYQQAFPVLQKYGMTATVFLWSGRQKKATAEDGRALDAELAVK